MRKETGPGEAVTGVSLWHLDKLPDRESPSQHEAFRTQQWVTPTQEGRESRTGFTCLVTSLRSMMGSLPCSGCFIAPGFVFSMASKCGEQFHGLRKVDDLLLAKKMFIWTVFKQLDV